MKKLFRRRYYDFFSRFYDRFVALHSGDRGGALREEFAAITGLRKGGLALDICTGTGSLLPCLDRHVGAEGVVFGIDFSMGMLRAAKTKTAIHPTIHLVQAEATALPFKSETLDLVTCSHAFYELKGDSVDRCLREVLRVLKGGGRFVMMEHDVPKSFFVRVLFYLRILCMGSRSALAILRDEEAIFRAQFACVMRTKTNRGGSKIFICQKRVESDSCDDGVVSEERRWALG
ncbi:MAG: hypothetical protein Kow0099_00050 [Candidatus Abyssubacteria bacterium]